MSVNKKQSSFVCPVCNDTSFDGHLEHWVRNQGNGSVVCPTILGISCGVCGERSHTTKKCLEKKREDRARRRSVYMSASDMRESESKGVLICNNSKSEQVRKVEELKRITADTPIVKIEKKERSFMRVFYSS